MSPCEAGTLADAPVLALEWDRSIETFLAAGSAPSIIALDYDIEPRSHVESVRAVWKMGGTLALEPFLLEETCPQSVDFSSLTAPLGDLTEDDVAFATVSATGGDGSAREGNLFFTVGALQQVIISLPPGTELDGDVWWLLFEPAAGPGRLAISQPSMTSGSELVALLPRMPGEVALVRTSALSTASSPHTIHAPAGFASDWRAQVSSWYGAVLAASPQEGAVVTLAAIQGSEPDAIRNLTPDSKVTSTALLAAVSGLVLSLSSSRLLVQRPPSASRCLVLATLVWVPTRRVRGPVKRL